MKTAPDSLNFMSNISFRPCNTKPKPATSMGLSRFFNEFSVVLRTLALSGVLLLTLLLSLFTLHTYLPPLLYPMFPNIPANIASSTTWTVIFPDHFRTLPTGQPYLAQVDSYLSQLDPATTLPQTQLLVLLTTIISLATALLYYASLPLAPPSQLSYYYQVIYHNIANPCIHFYLLHISLYSPTSIFPTLSLVHLCIQTLASTAYNLIIMLEYFFLPPYIVTALYLNTMATPVIRALTCISIIHKVFVPGAYLTITPDHAVASLAILFLLAPQAIASPFLATTTDKYIMDKWGFMSDERVREVEDVIRAAEPGVKEAKKKEERETIKKMMKEKGIMPGKGKVD